MPVNSLNRVSWNGIANIVERSDKPVICSVGTFDGTKEGVLTVEREEGGIKFTHESFSKGHLLVSNGRLGETPLDSTISIMHYAKD